jgi:hypothetical protein
VQNNLDCYVVEAHETHIRYKGRWYPHPKYDASVEDWVPELPGGHDGRLRHSSDVTVASSNPPPGSTVFLMPVAVRSYPRMDANPLGGQNRKVGRSRTCCNRIS